MSGIRRFFSPQFRERPSGIYRPISIPLELLPALMVLATWVPLGIFSSARYYLALAAVLLSCLAIRVVQLRKLGPDGEPIVAIEAETLIFRSLNIGHKKRFPLADIQQIRIYGQVGCRSFSFTLTGNFITILPTSFRREREQAIINFLQKALPGKVLIEPVPKTFFDRVRGDYS